jgi:hypothetical protein
MDRVVNGPGPARSLLWSQSPVNEGRRGIGTLPTRIYAEMLLDGTVRAQQEAAQAWMQVQTGKCKSVELMTKKQTAAVSIPDHCVDPPG